MGGGGWVGEENLTLVAERPVSLVQIILPLDNYTQSFTVLENYSIENRQSIQSVSTKWARALLLD